MPAVDILLPVRNGAQYISSAIESILHQSWRDWRLIILDHGSTDGTQDICEAFSKIDKRLSLHSFPEASGLSGLLNSGLDLCDAAYVMRQDADDISLPNRISLSMDAFAAHPDVVVVGGAAELIDGDGRRIGDRSMPCKVDAIQAAALFGNPIIHPTVIFNLKQFQNARARYGTCFLEAPNYGSITVEGLAEDYLLFGQFAILGQCINLDSKLIQYRIHSNSESESKAYAQREIALTISRFLCDSWANISGCRAFDTAPFCRFGELLGVSGRLEYRDEYLLLDEMLTSSVNDCAELRRILAFCRVLSDRRTLALFSAYAVFAFHFGINSDERHAVRKWITDRNHKRHWVSD